jgi:16S rRNA (uracil1498-N3)-methyltransferase
VTLHRFCCPGAAPDGDRVRIEGAAAVQIRRVLRLGPGDTVILFGADEWEYTVRLESVQPDMALGRILDRAMPRAEPRCELTLAMALLKGEKLEWVLQKGTELGVSRFLLMQTERTVAAPDERRVAGRRERYARIVQEATEQCGRVRPPCIEGPVPLARALAVVDTDRTLLLHTGAVERLSDLLVGFEARVTSDSRSAALARLRPSDDADATQARHSVNVREPSHLTLFVGPEGGFTETEVAAAAPVTMASLGSRVLRAETAALAAVTLAMDALDR